MLRRPACFALWAALVIVLSAESPADAWPCPYKPATSAAPAAAAAWQAPADLEDAVRRLAAARVALARTGQVRLRYTEAQLRAQAATGQVPNARYLARLIMGNPGPNNRMGTVRPSGRLPLWATTFEQLEPADTDPEAITRLLGLPFDAQSDYTLLVIRDLGADESARPPLICPTWPALTALAASDLATPTFPAGALRDAMSPDYQAGYRALMTAFYRRGFKESVPDDVERFVTDEPSLQAPDARRRFLARLRVHTQYGASDLFRGDGMTMLTGDQARQVGVLELFALDPAPKPIGEYEAAGRVLRVPCKPLRKPGPLQFLDPHDGVGF